MLVNNGLEHIWLDKMIWFQQLLRSFSKERHVAGEDSQAYLPRKSVPLPFALHCWLGVGGGGGKKSNRSSISSAYNFCLI